MHDEEVDLTQEFEMPAAPETRGNPELGATSKEREYDGANAALPDAFANDFEAQYEVTHEKAAHRTAVLMACQGHTNSEIAARLGMTPSHISNVLRQPWARARMIKESRNVALELRAKLEREGMKALDNLIEIANGEKTKPELKFAANKELVDRFLGKSVTAIANVTSKSEELSDAELDARIEERMRQKAN